LPQLTPELREAHLYAELWVSLASLLRSYTAAHGLKGNRQATVELGDEKIIVRHAEKWLALTRNGAEVAWTRENSIGGILEFTQDGCLRALVPLSAAAQKEPLDMAAEAWARELMQ
jgi:hypothetical protein